MNERKQLFSELIELIHFNLFEVGYSCRYVFSTQSTTHFLFISFLPLSLIAEMERSEMEREQLIEGVDGMTTCRQSIHSFISIY